MSSIDDIWKEMARSGEFGGFRRINVLYQHDAFCALDSKGRVGLVFQIHDEPDRVPSFDAMEISVIRRTDDRVTLSIFLDISALQQAFQALCEGLLLACESETEVDLPNAIVTYLVRTNSLLEFSDPKILGPIALRGLVGELVVLHQLLQLVPHGHVIEAWTGPYESPQDFTFSDRLLEVKTRTVSARTVLISSIEQLDPLPPRPLTLSVVTLSLLQEHVQNGVTPAELVSDIKLLLNNESTLLCGFENRLKAARYFDSPFYANVFYRLLSIRFYTVRVPFPRMLRSKVDIGVVSASYEIDLGECDMFETTLEGMWS